MSRLPRLAARLAKFVQVAALAALACVVGSCADDGDAPRAKATGTYDGSGKLLDGTLSAAAKPNVVLICLDTVREDAIRAHGDEPAAMPALAAYCDANTRFVDASGPASWTAPTVTSLLTGLKPVNHGVMGPNLAWPLVGSVATLAEYLKSAGYRTAAFTGGGWVSDEMGLGQGFDALRTGFTLTDPHHHLAKWLDGLDAAKPFFLFLHTYEAHDPYGRKLPPEGHDDPARVAAATKYAEAFRANLPKEDGPDLPAAIDGRELLLRWRSDPLTVQALTARVNRERVSGLVLQYTFKDHPRDPRHGEIEATLRARYRRGLGLVDAGFSSLMARLDERIGATPTIFVVVTDHGESIGENGVLGHGRWLTDVLTRVILAIRAPGRVPAGVVRGGGTLADVVPTLLELCGMPIPNSLDGRSLVERARAPTRGEADGRPVEAEEYRLMFGDGGSYVMRTASVRTTRAKYLGTRNPTATANEEQLFDLVADPAEEHPLPVADLARYGTEFVEAVARTRKRLDEMAKETISTGKPR